MRRRAGAVPAARVGIVRALVGGYTLAYLATHRRMFRQVARSEPGLFAPVGPVRALRRPLPPQVADALGDATLATTVLFTLGAGHRMTAPAHAALLTWTLAYRNSWSMIFHSDNLLVLHTLALSAGRAADAVAVDAAARGRRPAPHPRYGWPLRLMNATSAATYLLAGVAKVTGESGWSWARGNQLRSRSRSTAFARRSSARTPRRWPTPRAATGRCSPRWPSARSPWSWVRHSRSPIGGWAGSGRWPPSDCTGASWE